jgi:hypothetical protein
MYSGLCIIAPSAVKLDPVSVPRFFEDQSLLFFDHGLLRSLWFLEFPNPHGRRRPIGRWRLLGLWRAHRSSPEKQKGHHRFG